MCVARVLFVFPASSWDGAGPRVRSSATDTTLCLPIMRRGFLRNQQTHGVNPEFPGHTSCQCDTVPNRAAPSHALILLRIPDVPATSPAIVWSRITRPSLVVHSSRCGDGALRVQKKLKLYSTLTLAAPPWNY